MSKEPCSHNDCCGGLPKAEALDPDELVSYQPGSIVSRTLMRTTGGTVTVFAFAAGQGLSEHMAPFDALVQILDGEGELTIGGKRVTVSDGEMVLMPGNIPHAVHAHQDFKMMLVMLRGEPDSV
jgi:quercetin dioxygenase-like cupin family protein